jgi:hypothetical protein
MEAQTKIEPQRRVRRLASRLAQLLLVVAIAGLYLLVLSRGHLSVNPHDLLP